MYDSFSVTFHHRKKNPNRFNRYFLLIKQQKQQFCLNKLLLQDIKKHICYDQAVAGKDAVCVCGLHLSQIEEGHRVAWVAVVSPAFLARVVELHVPDLSFAFRTKLQIMMTESLRVILIS